jgi:hypothetical protein
MKTDHRQKFDALRERCLSTRVPFEAFKNACQRKYGFANRAWIHQLSRAEERKYDSLKKQVDKADEKMMALLDKISERDWHHGVPAHWVYTQLSYDDAVKPRSTPLSTVPPVAYGCREPMR